MRWSKYWVFWFLRIWKWEVDSKTYNRSEQSLTNLLRSRGTKWYHFFWTCPRNYSQWTNPSICPSVCRVMLFSEALEGTRAGQTATALCEGSAGRPGQPPMSLPCFPPATPSKAPGLGGISEDWLHIAWEQLSSWYKLLVKWDITILPDQTPSSSNHRASSDHFSNSNEPV